MVRACGVKWNSGKRSVASTQRVVAFPNRAAAGIVDDHYAVCELEMPSDRGEDRWGSQDRASNAVRAYR